MESPPKGDPLPPSFIPNGSDQDGESHSSQNESPPKILNITQATTALSPALLGVAKSNAQGAQEKGLPTPPPPKLSGYATMAGRGLTKTEAKSIWNGIRSQTDTNRVTEDNPLPNFMFTRTLNGQSLVIPFNRSVRADHVLMAGSSAFLNARQVNTNVPDHISKVGDILLPIYRGIFSNGRRLRIRADYVQDGTDEETSKALKATFAPYGNIILTRYHYINSENKKLRAGSLEFVLDFHPSVPRDVLIPRVAAIRGGNTLFTWGSTAFCYRCGRDDHTKALCPRPIDCGRGCF
ncbi:hypothetical protein BGZ76_003871 [Entomortierella beljakovae]|nr:hypothetical protein BGZ76_003871 [Entomortierella beljakovae]